MSQYRKSISALLFLVGTWGVTAFAEGGVNGVEWAGLLVVIGGSGAVWGLPNDTTPGDDGSVDPGSAALGALVAFVVAWVLWGPR